MVFSTTSSLVSDPSLKTPLLTTTSSSSSSSNSDDTPLKNAHFESKHDHFHLQRAPKGLLNSGSYISLAVLSGHVGSISCLALCGEFILSASCGKDIILWQQPSLHQFAKFGTGEGAVKALVTVSNKVFTAHQDSRIRVWRLSRRSENVFKLIGSLPTTKDYLGKFMKQSNYVQTRRNHRRLWIEHADSISCLAGHKGMIYSGSWDKTLKVWRVSDLKCLESIKAHDDAINGLVAHKGLIFSASADGTIKVWQGQGEEQGRRHCMTKLLEGHKDVSMNSVIVCEEQERVFVYGGGSDGSIMGWEGEKWKVICEVQAHKMAVLCMCVIGEYLCSGSADRTIGIWRRQVGGVIVKVGLIRGHEGPIKCLQASSYNVGGGFLLYSGGLDKTLRVWWVPMEKNCEEKTQNLLC